MRYLVLFMSVGVMVSSFSYQAIAEDAHTHQHHMQKEYLPEVITEQIEDAGNAFCPVMDQPVDKEVSYVHEGKRYYFCCTMCIEEFKKDPQKYIQKLQ